MEVLKGIDRALGAIFDGDSTGRIEEIKSITAGGVLTTINYKEDGEGDSWTSYFYDVSAADSSRVRVYRHFRVPTCFTRVCSSRRACATLSAR